MTLTINNDFVLLVQCFSRTMEQTKQSDGKHVAQWLNCGGSCFENCFASFELMNRSYSSGLWDNYLYRLLLFVCLFGFKVQLRNIYGKLYGVYLSPAVERNYFDCINILRLQKYYFEFNSKDSDHNCSFTKKVKYSYLHSTLSLINLLTLGGMELVAMHK